MKSCSSTLALLPLALVAVAAPHTADATYWGSGAQRVFNRISTVEVSDPVVGNAGSEVAEIVAATRDGRTLVYTDSEAGAVGFFDISQPAHPTGLGLLPVGGEPTSVDVRGPWALVAVSTGTDFVNPAGKLVVIRIKGPGAPTVVREIELGGQPDSIAVSPDGRYAAIAIENERDEDLCVVDGGDDFPITDDSSEARCESEGGVAGGLPQAPPGFLVIVDLLGLPAHWSTRSVDLTGLDVRFNEDPEPEFVDIDKHNRAVVSLQENNGFAIVDLRSGKVVEDFSAGEATVEQVDTVENDLIEPKKTIHELREPDAVQWVGDGLFGSANEGDFEGGSRNFTLFNKRGHVVFDAGKAVEHVSIRLGHYPEDRSENKGAEPEGAEFARFGRDAYFFLGLERAGLVQVWRRKAFGKPEFVQALPTGYRPEGILAIPRRGLLVVANEENEGFFRSSLSIYLRKRGTADYPTVQSVNRADGVPIPWGALSALAADSKRADKLYTVHDSFYVNSRIYTLDVGQRPARITREWVLKKDGSLVAYDLEGLARRPCEDGGFWAVSEGSGAAGDAGSTLNLLLKIAEDGTVLEEIPLPDETNAKQRRFGFEGVTVTGRCGNTERVYVAFQREWDGDPGTESGGSDCAADGDCAARIARYRPKNGNWKFVYYPLDAPTSPAGGWVGLSEVTALDRETFVVIERDNQGGRDARIKQLCTFSIEGLQFRKERKAPDFDFISKDGCVDILPDLKAPAGQVLDKPEGFAVAADGRAFVVTDNDGVDDTSGETQFFSPGHLDELF